MAYYFLKVCDNMQKGRVLSLKNFRCVDFLQKNYILLIILFFLLLGIIFGIFRFDNTEELKNYFNDYTLNFVEIRSGTSFWRILFVCFLRSLAVLFLLFLLGASLFGVITLPAAIFIKGFLQGGVAAFLYSQYGLKGIAFNAVIFIPSTITFIIIMILASCESVKFSLRLSNLTLSQTLPQNLSVAFKNYSIKFSLLAVLTLVASLVEAIIAIGLIKNFSLI